MNLAAHRILCFASAATTAALLTCAQAQDVYQQALLKAGNANAGDEFGAAVAISGDTMVVGAPSEGRAHNSPSAGAVYVFTRTAGAWAQTGFLKASNASAGDRFGHAVAISGDTIVVGANGEDSAGPDGTDDFANNAGAAYVFTRSNGAWVQQALLKADNAAAGDAFGSSVSIDGGSIAVGALAESSHGAASGAVYVFSFGGSEWTQQANLKAGAPGAGDYFGFSVSLHGDLLVVGAAQEDSGAQGVGGNETDNSAADSGAAYIFRRNGPAWTQEAYLKAGNAGSGDQFGFSVAVLGNLVAVTAPREASAATGVNASASDNSAAGAGAAYVFRHGTTGWHQEAYVKSSNAAAGDGFGQSVAVGDRCLVVGAMGEDSQAIGVNGSQTNNILPASGAAYVFDFTDGEWSQTSYLKASNTGKGDQFGRAVSLSGRSLVVGANLESSPSLSSPAEDSAPAAGAAYVFVPVGPPGPEPELDIELASGESLADAGSSVDFGLAGIGKPAATRNLIIFNRGEATLLIHGISITGGQAGAFEMDALPASVGPGVSISGEVRFSPSTVGRSEATLEILTNDTDEASFEIELSGAAVPEINISGNDKPIIHGDPLPEAGDGSAFGAVNLGSSSANHVFLIENIGVEDLVLGAIAFRGRHPNDFQVMRAPDPQVLPGGSTTVEIAFAPSHLGSRQAVISFPTNDSDENPFEFALEGVGVGPGLPDSDFGSAGMVRTAIGSGSARATGVALQQDGKIVVVGRSENSADSDVVVLRYLADGSSDPAFGDHGRVSTAVGSSFEEATGVALQPDGKIVVCGFAFLDGNDDFFTARYLSDGQLDASFGEAGIVTTALGESDDRAYGIAIQPDGKILVVGSSHDGTSANVAVVRYRPDGSVDFGFGDGGKRVMPLGDGDAFARGIALQRDGKLVVAGEAFLEFGKSLFLLRLDSYGTEDAEFGVGGSAILVGDESGASSVAIDPTGHIVVGGWLQTTSAADWLVARFRTNGSLDPDFGVGGIAVLPQSEGHDEVRALAVQADGAVFASGFVRSGLTDDFALARFTAGGQLDGTFGETGQVITPVGNGTDRSAAMVIQNDGQVVTAGHAEVGNHEEIAMVRYSARQVVLPPALVVEQVRGVSLGAASAVDFGVAQVGGASRRVAIILRNLGTLPVEISGAAITGNHSTEFSIDPTLAMEPIAGGGEREIILQFSPATTGLRESSLHLASNAPATPELTISLQGTGAESVPTIALSGPSGGAISANDAPSTVSGTHFGNADTREAIARTFTIQNTGAAPLILGNPAIQVWGGVGAFRVTRQPETAVPAGGSVTFELTFQPSTPGPKQALVAIASNDVTFSYEVSGVGVGVPEIAVMDGATELVSTQGSVNLGEVTAGAGSISRTLVIANRGTADLVLGAIGLQGSQLTGFSCNTSSTLQSVRPGGQTQVTVSFASDTAAARTASLAIGSNDVGSNPFVVEVTASAVLPAPRVTVKTGGNPISAGGAVQVGGIPTGATASRIFEITNAGNALLHLEPVVLQGIGFSISRQLATQVLAPGASTDFEITFQPTSLGEKTGSVSLLSDATAQSPFAFQLMGTGVGLPEIDVVSESGELLADASSTLDFGLGAPGGSAVVKRVLLINRGDVSLHVGSVAVGGTHAADFTLDGPAALAEILPEGSVELSIGFIPGAAGRRSAWLRVASDDDDEASYEIALTGAAFPEIEVAGNANRIVTGDGQPELADFTDFDSADVNGGTRSRHFRVTNSGTTPLTLGPVTLAGPQAGDFSLSNSPPETLAPGESGSLVVAFDPAGLGNRDAEILIPSDDVDEPLFRFSIRGHGIGSGSLDLDFGTAGLAIPQNLAGDEHARGIAVQADHKVVVAGFATRASGTDTLVARYGLDGKLDLSFGSGGIFATAGLTDLDEATDVAIQPDGRILVAGFVYDGQRHQFLVLRLTATGSLDPTFGSAGIVRTSVGTSDAKAVSLALQKDGRIVLAGTSILGDSSRLAMVRYLPDGTVDQSFADSGLLLSGFGSGNEIGSDVALQDDGKIVVAGSSGTQLFAARFLTDGTADGSFGSSGRIMTALSPARESGGSLAIDTLGRIVLAGTSEVEGRQRFCVVRYSPDGVLDSSFAGAGTAFADFSGSAQTSAIRIQSDGRIVLAGSVATDGFDRDFAVARFTAAGSLDVTFGGTGAIVVPVGPNDNWCEALALHTDGCLLMAGSSVVQDTRDLALVRLSGDTSTEVPVLISPIASDRLGNPVVLSFVLPEPARLGTVLVSFTGAAVHELQLEVSSGGRHDVSVDVNSPATSPGVTSGNAIPPGTYEVTLSYRDVAGNPAAVTSVADVTVVDVSPPTGGEMTVTPTGRIALGSELTVDFPDWFDFSGPLSYAVELGGEGISPAGSSSIRTFSVNTPGQFTLNGRVSDSAGNFVELSRTITVGSPQEIWRFQHFGTAADSGSTAESADPDGDGLSNLLEFAFGTDPRDAADSSRALRYSGTLLGDVTGFDAGQPVIVWERPPQVNPCAEDPACVLCWETGDPGACELCDCEPVIVPFEGQFLFVRRADFAAAGLTYTLESSNDLKSWSDATAIPAVRLQTGDYQLLSVPATEGGGTPPRRFLRLRVQSGG